MARAIECAYRKGCRFSTYGTWWIKQAVIKALAENGKAIKIPIHLLNTIKKCFSIARQLTQELGKVLNGGLDFEHTLNQGVSVYAAFHTDFSASVGGPGVSVAASDMDLYHASGGVAFRIRGNRFTLGALWAGGGKTRPIKTLVDSARVPGSVLGSDVDVRYSKITFLLGFEFGR